MGLSDNSLYLDARRSTNQAVPNLGTAGPALDATVEGDILRVEGPAVWFPGLSGAGHGNVGLELSDPFPSMDVSTVTTTFRFYFDARIAGSFPRILGAESNNAGMRLYLANSGANLVFGINDGAGAYNMLASDAVTINTWQWWRTVYESTGGANNTGQTLFYKSPDGVTWSLVTTVPAPSGRGPMIAPEELVIGNSFAVPRPFAGSVSDMRIEDANGIVFDFTASDITATDPGADTILTSSGHTLDVNRPSSGPMTTIVPGGRTLLINPDEDDTDNKVTTGQGIVAEATMWLPDVSNTNLETTTADGIALVPGGTDLTILMDFGPVGWNYTADTADALRSLGTNKGLVVRKNPVSGRVQLLLGDGSGLTAWQTDDPPPDGSRHIAIVYRETAGLMDAYYSADGVTWTLIGQNAQTPITSAATDRALEIGYGGTERWDNATIAGVKIAHEAGVDGGVLASPTWALELTPADLARGAEGATTFPASTGQTMTVNGDVTFYPTAFSSVEPTATFDGVAGTYESVPNESSLVPSTGVCVIADLRLDAWLTGTEQQDIVGLYGPNDRCFRVFVDHVVPGRLGVNYSADGSANLGPRYASAAFDGLADGDRRWVAWMIQGDNGSGNSESTYWDGGSGDVPVWTLHTTRTVTGAITLHQTSRNLLIGENNGVNTADGQINSIRMYDGVGDGSAPGLGTLVFERNRADIAQAATLGVGDGDSYQSASGHTVTSNGGITYTGDAPLVIPADQDALLMWAGMLGNQTGAGINFLRAGSIAGSDDARLSLERQGGADGAFSRVKDGIANIASSPVTLDPPALDVFAAWIDRNGALLHNYRIESDGTVTETTVDISSVGTIIPTEGLTSLEALPGTMSGVVFDAGGTYTEETITAIAEQLLRTYSESDIPRDAGATITSNDVSALLTSSDLRARLV